MDQPLQGRTVVVTRAASQAAELSTRSRTMAPKCLFARPSRFANPTAMNASTKHSTILYGYDWLIFTSANGVEFFMQRLTKSRIEG